MKLKSPIKINWRLIDQFSVLWKEQFIEFKNKPLIEKMFYYIFVPWNGEPKEKHYWLRSAKIEAQRIAKKTWKEVFILQVMKSYKINKLVETNYQNI